METSEIKLMTAEETSEKFFMGKKSYGAMAAMARKKQLPAVKIGNRLYFEENALNSFFAAQIASSNAEIVDSKQQRQEKVAGIKRID